MHCRLEAHEGDHEALVHVRREVMEGEILFVSVAASKDI